MTLDEIKKSDAVFLLPSDISEVLDCDAQAIRDIARAEPERLGFPIIRMGTRTRIPRKAFLKFLGEDVT